MSASKNNATRVAGKMRTFTLHNGARIWRGAPPKETFLQQKHREAEKGK